MMMRLTSLSWCSKSELKEFIDKIIKNKLYVFLSQSCSLLQCFIYYLSYNNVGDEICDNMIQ